MFQVWKCSCQENDSKHICDGFLERDLPGSSGAPANLWSKSYNSVFSVCAPDHPQWAESFPKEKASAISDQVTSLLNLFMSFLFIMLFLHQEKTSLRSPNLKLTVIENNTVIESRAIGDALNMMCHFYALNILPLGDVMMIAAVRVPSCQNVYMITILFPGDHCQPLLLHFPEGTLWGLWDPQHLHRNQHSCHIWIFCCQHRVTFSFSLSSFL